MIVRIILQKQNAFYFIKSNSNSYVNNCRVTISTCKCKNGANVEYFIRNYQLLFRLLDNGVTCRLNLN